MVRRMLASIALATLASTWLSAADHENPFKKAEKGQWVSYRLSIVAMKDEQIVQVTHRVTSVNDKSVTFETNSLVNGQKTPAQVNTIDLSKPYDRLSAANFGDAKDTKVEVKDSGKESLEIAGKKYDCEWARYAVSLGPAGKRTTADVKIWFCKDVPLHGLVKMDIASESLKIKMEIEKIGKD